MNTEQAIEKLAAIIGESGNAIVEQYTHWHITNALMGLVFGGLVMAFAYRWKPLFIDNDHVSGILKALRVSIIFIGATMAFGNAADLINPQAAAIHQLITDITGR